MGILHLARYRRSLFDAGLVDPHDTEEDRDEELCLSQLLLHMGRLLDHILLIVSVLVLSI
jgi:hypothetical protein